MIYNCYDTESGLQVSSFANVMSTQRLTGGAVTTGEDLATVASTALLWPGMRVVGRGIPANTLVLSVDSDTTFTMTGVATATATGLILVAHAYIDAAVVRAINIEHYRDLFGGSTSFSVGPGGATIPQACLGIEGAGTYITSPVAISSTTGSQTVSSLSGTLTAAVDDRLAHVAPRTQTRDVTTHFLVCTDGTILPVAVFPSMHLAQGG